MKIVIATPILYNETSPFNHLFKDIIGGFLEDGNQIIRLVACEDKSESAFKYGYTGDNIEYRLYKRKNSSHSNIISRYIKDSLTNMRQALSILGMKDIDVLFEDVSYSSFWSVLAAKIKGIKVVAMLQDVWPDNAVQSNLIGQDSILYKYFEIWQRFVYKKADRIICISDDMKEFIASKGINRDKIEVIYNWGYSDEIVNISWNENEFVKKYNLDENKFYAVYAGNIGKMQNVEIVVEAAKHLKEEKNIEFLIIGDGARREHIENMVKQYQLDNVTMLPFQPSELAVHIYSAAGVNIIPLVEGGIKTALPSKTGVVLSCGHPVVFCFGEECKFSNLLKKYSFQECISTRDNEKLAKTISEQEKKHKDETYENIYALFKDYFMCMKNSRKYAEAIKKV